MKRLTAILRWPWWTLRSWRRARRRAKDEQWLASTEAWLAGLPHVRPSRWLRDQWRADRAEGSGC